MHGSRSSRSSALSTATAMLASHDTQRPHRPRAAPRAGLPHRRRHRRGRGLDGRGLPRRAGQPGRHRGRGGRRRRVAAPPPRRSQLVPGQGQGRGAARRPPGDRLHAARGRRRAVAQPAALAGGAALRQGARPQRPHPRHLRAARPDPRGSPPGRAGPARVPAAAPDAPLDAPLAHGRRHRHPRSRRDPAGDRPSRHPRPHPASSRSASSRCASSARPPDAPAIAGSCPASPSWATRTPASRRCSTR